MITTNRGGKLYLVTLLALAAFLILKVQRGFSVTEEQGGIWNIIQVIFVIGGLYSSYSLNRQATPFSIIKIYKILMYTVWIMSIPFFLFSETKGFSTIFRFLMVPYGMLVFMLFYNLGLNNDIKKYPYIIYTAFFVIFYLLFKAMGMYYLVQDDKGAVADVYYVVGLLPLIFIYTPPKMRIVPFLIACVAVMMTAKRNGFIALATILILYFLPKDSKGGKSYFLRFFSFLIILVISYVVITKLTSIYELNMFDRLAKLNEDGGANRATFWSKLIDVMSNESNILPFIVGHGHGATYELLNIHAHNEFLEFLYNYGIIVFFLYVSFFISMIKECFRMYKAEFTYAKEFMVAIVVSFFLAMFSFYMVDCTHITCCSVCLGLILAEWYKYKQKVF